MATKKFVQALSLKSKNYRKVAVIEIVLIFLVLILGDMMIKLDVENPHTLVSAILLIPEAVYLIILYQLAQLLNPDKKVQQIIKIAIIIVFLISFVALNPFVDVTEWKTNLLILTHVFLCGIECYIIALGLKDIYAENLHITERLWGSVAVYLLIALGWASFYEVFLLLDHSALGFALEPGYQTYSESLYFSLCSLSGTGSAYPNPTHIIRNLALMESVWGVLFLVMLIGRLFSLPAKD